MQSKPVSVSNTHTAAVAETLETYVVFRTRVHDTRQVHRVSPGLFWSTEREFWERERPGTMRNKPGLGQGRVEQAHRDLQGGVP